MRSPGFGRRLWVLSKRIWILTSRCVEERWGEKNKGKAVKRLIVDVDQSIAGVEKYSISCAEVRARMQEIVKKAWGREHLYSATYCPIQKKREGIFLPSPDFWFIESIINAILNIKLTPCIFCINFIFGPPTRKGSNGNWNCDIFAVNFTKSLPIFFGRSSYFESDNISEK